MVRDGQMQGGDRTNTMAGNDSFEVPFCDGFDVPLHSPGRGVNDKCFGNSNRCDGLKSHSLSLPPAHTSRLWGYDHGLRALVKTEKVLLEVFEYCFSCKQPIGSERGGRIPVPRAAS